MTHRADDGTPVSSSMPYMVATMLRHLESAPGDQVLEVGTGSGWNAARPEFTFGDDTEGQETIRYVHRLLGYSITGDVGAQVMCLLYGTGSNGKSVLLDVMIKLMGDYADAAPPGFLMAKNFESPPTWPNSTAAASSCARKSTLRTGSTRHA